MPREYCHTEEYEKEIIRLWEEGKTLRRISEQLGFRYRQIRNFKTRYNEKKRKIAAGIILKKKGRPAKDNVVTEEDKLSLLRYKLARKDARIKQLEMEKERKSLNCFFP